MAEKDSAPAKQSLYGGEKKRLRLPVRLFPLPLLLAGLVAAHFLNVFLQWAVVRAELSQKPAFQSPEYSFLGFSPLHQEEIDAVRRLPNAAPTGRVFAFFDLLHPAVFMVWNNGGEGDFFDLGPILAALPAGASRVAFFPGAMFVLSHGKERVARNHGGSILGAIWARSLNEKWAGAGLLRGGPPISFVLKPPQGSLSLRVPYLVYFYLPLALIVVAIAVSGTAMALAFLYYAGMFFLFDYERLFVTVPLDWLFKALGIELPDPWVKALAIALALGFLAAAVLGLWRWRDREMPPASRWIVLFFVLLPLFLFF